MRKNYGKRIGISLLCASMVFGATACGASDTDKAEVKEAVDLFAEADEDEAEETVVMEESDVTEEVSEEEDLFAKLMGQTETEESTEETASEEETSNGDFGENAGFERGTIEGNVYTNPSVGIKATVPEGLTIADKETVQEFEDAALASIESSYNVSDERMEEFANAMIYDAVITSDAGSSIQIAAENMNKTMLFKVSAEEYLDNLKVTTKSTYESIGCTAEFTEVETVKLGGKDFANVSIEIDYEGVAIGQDCYCCAVGDYMYYIIVTDMGDATADINTFFDSFEAIE